MELGYKEQRLANLGEANYEATVFGIFVKSEPKRAIAAAVIGFIALVLLRVIGIDYGILNAIIIGAAVGIMVGTSNNNCFIGINQEGLSIAYVGTFNMTKFKSGQVIPYAEMKNIWVKRELGRLLQVNFTYKGQKYRFEIHPKPKLNRNIPPQVEEVDYIQSKLMEVIGG